MPETDVIPPREWTLMFYFASDNPLARGIVSQLKTLKQAGFHPEANVIVHFDPNTENMPVQIFDVNVVNKIRSGGKHKIGFSLDPPFGRNLVEDKLWGKKKKEIIRAALKKELGGKSINYVPPDTPAKMSGEQNPKDALHTFLEFCRKHYPARHYMLFILAHGLVMDNNLFLFDEHAKEHSLSLIELGSVLRRFKRKLAAQKAQFQLVSFHSCSMGALEVAYELQGTANYMLAAEGPAFVGSWPYAQILATIFNTIGRLVAAENCTKNENRDGSPVGKKEDPATIMKDLLKEVWNHCYINSYDFQLAGYSLDVSLCDLKKVQQIRAPLKELSSDLIRGLADPVVKERILLAHWDAQTYWQESYTDLYDFCFRLHQRCQDLESAYEKTRTTLQSIQEKCDKVIRVLTSGDDNLIIRSDFTGPAYQYSHGLFVFFPWSEPADRQFWLKEYGSYKFKETSWRKFLDRYFQSTMRQPRGYEQHSNKGFEGRVGLDEILLENITGREINCEAQLGRGGSMSANRQRGNRSAFNRGAQLTRKDGFWPFDPGDPMGPEKGGPEDPTGDDSGYASIKNYPSVSRGPVENEESRKQSPTRKLVTKK
ncbi:MAG TPA: clostripain-related cysteine peptidase [Pyrinomonadaceae bacterium]|nr:clostripain-related cysteine peptidase [Pyrinomonadaceae bacterium]